MSDFQQQGLLSTLQRIAHRRPANLSAELVAYGAQVPIVLLLPCHGADLRARPFRSIIDALGEHRWLRHIVLSLNALGPGDLETARLHVAEMNCPVSILHTDTPRVKSLLDSAQIPTSGGKGLNLWAAIGVARMLHPSAVVAAHDTDIGNYKPELLERLVYPAVCPELAYQLAKGYYHRAADRLYGRVTRLFFIPLVSATIRLTGHSPLLDFLEAFRYPLSGEFAGRLDLLENCRMEPGYGFEIALLCETFRTIETSGVCQVDIGPNFQHRHQPLNHAGSGLSLMCGEIASTLLRYLAAEGLSIPPDFATAWVEAYRVAASECIQRYGHVARINGLKWDLEAEESAVQQFTEALVRSASAPAEKRPPQLPAWAELDRQQPGFATDFLEVVRVG